MAAKSLLHLLELLGHLLGLLEHRRHVAEISEHSCLLLSQSDCSILLVIFVRWVRSAAYSAAGGTACLSCAEGSGAEGISGRTPTSVPSNSSIARRTTGLPVAFLMSALLVPRPIGAGPLAAPLAVPSASRRGLLRARPGSASAALWPLAPAGPPVWPAGLAGAALVRSGGRVSVLVCRGGARPRALGESLAGGGGHVAGGKRLAGAGAAAGGGNSWPAPVASALDGLSAFFAKVERSGGSAGRPARLGLAAGAQRPGRRLACGDAPATT